MKLRYDDITEYRVEQWLENKNFCPITEENIDQDDYRYKLYQDAHELFEEERRSRPEPRESDFQYYLEYMRIMKEK